MASGHLRPIQEVRQATQRPIMNTTKLFQLGSISTGTLRTEDLLQAFTAKLIELGNPPDIDDVDAMQDALQALCPPFVYFGAHPGDGADFGFWPDAEALAEYLSDALLREYVYKLDVIIEVCPGNVTVMNSDRQILWSTV